MVVILIRSAYPSHDGAHGAHGGDHVSSRGARTHHYRNHVWRRSGVAHELLKV